MAPLKNVEVKKVPELPPRNKAVSFESTSPWNATGFYYTPRYPQSHRGKKKLHIFLNPHCNKLHYKCFLEHSWPEHLKKSRQKNL